jgi:hypothetical protein
MSEMLVMRRANGDLLTEEIGGKRYIPAWTSIDALLRYKERNPQLMIYLPRHVDRSLLTKVAASSDAASPPQFFLLSDDSPEAGLRDGRPVSVDDVLSQPAPLTAN